VNPFLLIALLAGFPALSTDMYLPALPALRTSWNLSFAQVNTSLVLFFGAFSCFLLVYGPLSDRFGRRPVLIGGLALFIAGSLGSAASQNIAGLAFARLAQGAGAASASSMALALTKDLYAGPQQKRVLAHIGVIVPLVPMLAPMFGTWTIAHASWRAIFLIQATLAAIALYGVCAMKEPLRERTRGGLFALFANFATLLRNRPYRQLVLCFSFAPLCFYTFLAASGSIYMQDFGVTAEHYGLLIGFNAIALISGSATSGRISRHLDSTLIIRTAMPVMFLAGLVMLLWHPGAASFAASMFVVSFCLGLCSPLSNHMVLQQVSGNVGAAAAFLSFCAYTIGATSMQLVSFFPAQKITSLAICALVGSVLPMLGLYRFLKSR